MLYVTSDHGGFELKQTIIEYLKAERHEYIDLGAKESDANDDYPDYAGKMAHQLKGGDLGIALCASGQGICLALNRFKHIRAAQGWSVESAQRARGDDNANVLCLAGTVDNLDNEQEIVKAFINTKFSGEERFTRRLKKIEEIENRTTN